VVSNTTVETQVVFKMLLTLVTSQLAIAGQLGREDHLWRTLGVDDRNDLEEDVLVDKAARDGFVLFWEAMAELEVEAFPCF